MQLACHILDSMISSLAGCEGSISLFVNIILYRLSTRVRADSVSLPLPNSFHHEQHDEFPAINVYIIHGIGLYT